MRFCTSRVSAFVGTAVALLAAVVLASPRDLRENGRDRDNSAIRFTRGGLQRFDTGDAVVHHGEEADPLPALAADGLDASQLSSTAAGPPGAWALPSPLTTVRPDPTRSPAVAIRFASSPLARPRLPALGRAPPSA